MESKKLKIGISQGDINSISYEVILKTLSEPKVYEPHAVILYGSAKVAAYYKKALNINQLNINVVNSAREAEFGAINLINCTDDDVKVEFGKSTPIAGKASFQALEAATADMKAGLIDVLVTGPINKKNIQSSSFQFPGHTEYLEQVFGEGDKALMLMVSDIMRVAVVTGHIALSEVSTALSVPLLLQKIKSLDQSLQKDFGISKPRIAVLALNPHAGEEGLLGREEIEIIAPAIQKAQDQGYYCFGPIAADGFFGADYFSQYDAILAMYHDQGLIPFKALCRDEGVNFSAGLPIVRTSPAHGTAYALTGNNEASESSFRAALYLACDIFKNRVRYFENNSNPLKKQHIVHSGDLSDLPVQDEE
ncbi:MAG: 4-hydroxythreonine-4-phosphate dehydrogenase PdxA [Bacteroidales bacterium]|nr:4-hydroxythreonine-4-phosphate dehydrogenase PdxA [Bacteroidales bacterium]